jgi:hypothetical protein
VKIYISLFLVIVEKEIIWFNWVAQLKVVTWWINGQKYYNKIQDSILTIRFPCASNLDGSNSFAISLPFDQIIQ